MDKDFLIPNSIKKHAVFQACYVDGASSEELARILTKMIDEELCKPECDRDMELIEQCSTILAGTLPKECQLSEQELDAKLAQLKADAGHGAGKAGTKLRVSVWKRVVAVAAILVLASFMALSVVAVNQGYGNAFEYVANKFSAMFGMKPGDQTESALISVTRDGEMVRYSSIEDVIKCENLKILYPAMLPDSVLINRIDIVAESLDTETIYFVFNDSRYSLSIRNKLTDVSKLQNFTIYTSNKKDFYIQSIGDMYQATCQYKSIEYSISAPTKETLIFIIDNIQEAS